MSAWFQNSKNTSSYSKELLHSAKVIMTTATKTYSFTSITFISIFLTVIPASKEEFEVAAFKVY